MKKRKPENSRQNDANQLKLFERPTEKWQPVRDDFNFCRLALFAIGDKKTDRFRDIEQKYNVEINGMTFEALWEVRHDPKLGLPGAFDRDVWHGLLEIGQRPEFKATGIAEFYSSRDFLKLIGKKSGGGNWINNVKEAIQRLTLTTFISRRSFNCPTSGGYLQLLKPIHLIEECGFKGEPDGKGGFHEKTWVKFGEFVRKNLESGYIALLDVQYIRSLDGEISKLLVPFLSYRFWLAVQRGRDNIQIHWQELATFLAAVGWDSLSRAKKRLKQAIGELKERRYIDASSDWSGEYYVFRIGEKFLDELRNRIDGKAQFNNWVQGKQSVKQLVLLPAKAPPDSEPSTDALDDREIVLTRQAIRIAFFNQAPDFDVLTKYGWTKEDVESLAANLKNKTTSEQSS